MLWWSRALPPRQTTKIHSPYDSSKRNGTDYLQQQKKIAGTFYCKRKLIVTHFITFFLQTYSLCASNYKDLKNQLEPTQQLMDAYPHTHICLQEGRRPWGKELKHKLFYFCFEREKTRESWEKELLKNEVIFNIWVCCCVNLTEPVKKMDESKSVVTRLRIRNNNIIRLELILRL